MSDGAFNVEELLGLPRMSGLAVSEGGRLVAVAARQDEKGKKYVPALYELDPEGEAPPRRLTRSAAGESSPAFAPDGSLFFASARPDPDPAEDDPRGERPALWRLPAGGGEAHVVAAPPGGVDAFAIARETGDVVFAAGTHPGAGGWKEDAGREKARKEAGVGAQLFTEYPIRLWDRYLGPRERHLYYIPAESTWAEDPSAAASDLTPEPGGLLEMAAFDLTPDGSAVVTTRRRDTEDPSQFLFDLVAIDVSSARARLIAGGEGEDASYGSPACSPDGRYVAAVRRGLSTPDDAAGSVLWLVDLESGEGRGLTYEEDLMPEVPRWYPGSEALLFAADEDGHRPLFRVEPGGAEVVRLTEEGAFESHRPHPGGTVYALRSTVGEPPRPVALEAGSAKARPLPAFGEIEDLRLPARVERLTAKAGDGTPVRSWLLLPPGASAEDPAPLATFIHGGPVNSWNGWHWRWNPHVFVDEGWAVLLPDPALSTGYGLDFIRRGWGRWGDVVYGDLMSAVDGALDREDLDERRTVAMGGSFGGYMANWIAGQTGRFDALVTHASLWDLETFHGTTDLGVFWEREFGDPYTDAEHYREHSPHRCVGNISTPMLVIHGEQDYRVPIGEALKLWTDLKRHGVSAEFLYFPDENHWVRAPNNARLWYETVISFIQRYVLAEKRELPELL